MISTQTVPSDPISGASDGWQSVIDRVTKGLSRRFDKARRLLTCRTGIVKLTSTSVRAFDQISAAACGGTGFVVDAERGILLTNRHIVTTGPITATATFLDKEEVLLTPIYR